MRTFALLVRSSLRDIRGCISCIPNVFSQCRNCYDWISDDEIDDHSWALHTTTIARHKSLHSDNQFLHYDHNGNSANDDPHKHVRKHNYQCNCTTGDRIRKVEWKSCKWNTGVLVAIIVGPILAIAICIGVFLFIRKRRAAKKNEALRLNSANYPPSNGPVGADQVYPYEVDVNQASGPPHHQFGYYGPKIDTYEVDAHSTMRKEKTPVMSGVAEMGRPYQEDLRSPAPTYTEALMPVEMDATPSLRSQTRQ